MSSPVRRARLVFNPASGRRSKRRRLPRVVAALRRAGLDVEPAPTERPGHATELARAAAAAGVDLVVVWGGDGTLNEVAAGLVGRGTPVAVVPGGTVNVFARETGIPLDSRAACALAGAGAARAIPVGIANGRPFLLMAGVGLDAEVVRTLPPRLKALFGTAAFWLHGFRRLAASPFPSFRVEPPAAPPFSATALVAGKLPRYGTGYRVTPEARLEAAWLDVVAFRGARARDYLRYLAGVVARRHLRFRDVVHFHATALRIEGPETVSYQLDGEVAGRLPLALGVRDAALRVVLPTKDGPAAPA